MLKTLVTLTLGFSLSTLVAAEVAQPGASAPASDATTGNLGTNMVGTSSAELGCLLQKADPEVKEKNATTTADGMEKALKKMQFSPGEMNRTGLMHFLSQVLAETGHLATTEQIDAPSEKKKGYGLIQVTGEPNLKESAKCMDEKSPPDGTNMLANKSAAVGDGTSNRSSAALVSLCWWKKNVVENRAHSKVAKDSSGDASQKMTQIVNAGGIGRDVTKGKANLLKREKLFKSLVTADNGGSCRRT